jgi:hypothetical protein
MGSIRDETIAKLSGIRKETEETVDGVKKKAEDMSVVRGAITTARELSGAVELEAELDRKDKKLEGVEKQRDQAIEDKHKAEIDTVKSELGAKIDALTKAYIGGASKESIAEQIVEIKKAANELNMGGSKISEIREMLGLITTLNPQKSMVDQIRDAKELISAIVPQPGKPNEFQIAGMPATIALELKKMDTNLQVTLETMKDDRERRSQEFALKIKQFDLERQDKIGEAQGRIAVEKERNKMLAGGLETIGRSIGRGMAEGSRQGVPPVSSMGQKAAEQPKSYHIELGENEPANFDCPNCSEKIAVGPDSTQAQCVGCNSKFPIIRKPATQVPESQSLAEEE